MALLGAENNFCRSKSLFCSDTFLFFHSCIPFSTHLITDVCVVKKEAQRNKGGTAKHSKWRNYDDLNEYFWYVSFKIVSF